MARHIYTPEAIQELVDYINSTEILVVADRGDRYSRMKRLYSTPATGKFRLEIITKITKDERISEEYVYNNIEAAINAYNEW